MVKLKIIICCFIVFFSFSFIVNAEECRKDDIKIESVNLIETQGNIEETITPNNDDNKVNLGLKMNVIGDSSTYKIVIKNVSDKDYVFDKNEIQKDYVNYEITYEDETNIVKAGEEKNIYLILNYNSKPQENNLSNGVFSNSSRVSFNLRKESNIIDNLINPNTGSSIFYIVFISLILVLVFVLKKKYRISTLIVLLLLLITPKIVNAVCTCSLDINLDMVIDAKEAIFLPGGEVNIKMKQLAGDDTSSVEYGYRFSDELVTAILYSEVEPNESNKEEKNIVSIPNSSYPIYMWYDNGIVYWWSEDKTPSLNEDARYMFCSLTKLVDISGLEKFDVSCTKYLSSLFYETIFSSLMSISNWNISNVTSLSSFLAYNKSIVNTVGIEDWDVSNVTSFNSMFRSCFALEEVDFSNWKTDSLTDMGGIFGMVRDNGAISFDGSLKRLYISNLFNTSHVTNMNNLFAGQDEIEDYSFLQYFDTSNVTNFNGTFINNLNLLDDTYFKDWDVTNAENFHITFSGCSNLKKIDLSKWNPKALKDMRFMFSYDDSLEEIDISSLDTSKVTQFWGLFNDCTKLKHIYVGNKWDISANTSRTDMAFPSTCELPNFSRSNPNYRDLSYAHTGEGGYLTLKTS